MCRVAIYAREAPGRAGQRRLERQVAGLASHVARQPGWVHVATYADQGLGPFRPGLGRMLAEAPGRFELVAVDGYSRLSADHHHLDVLLAQLRAVAVGVVVLRLPALWRLARMAAKLALADLVVEAAR